MKFDKKHHSLKNRRGGCSSSSGCLKGLTLEFMSSMSQTGRKRRLEGCSVITQVRLLGCDVDCDEVCLCLCITSIKAHI